MKSGSAWAALLGCALLCPVLTTLRAQNNPLKHASDFSSVEYFDPPNQMQISSRLSGAEAVPQPSGLVFVKEMKLETFSTDGRLQYIVEAPACTYDEIKGTAASPGRLKVQSADGQVKLEGEGFLWQGDEKFLTISNKQNTVIANPARLKTTP
jgi:hypothetical protein